MIVQIQQTALLVAAISIGWVVLDGRKADNLSGWYMAIVIVPLLISVVVLVITTLIRIWS